MSQWEFYPQGSDTVTAPLEGCAIRNCRRSADLWIGPRQYLCEFHADAAWRQVEMRDTTQTDATVPGAEGREYERAEARAKRSSARRKPTAMGQIYFVRMDGLIKVGWTTKLADRVRSYGPKALLLANYPGTRADEANLHRQLAPSRHSGREWYHEDDVVTAFITEAIGRHGAPRFEQIAWTRPKEAVRPRRR